MRERPRVAIYHIVFQRQYTEIIMLYYTVVDMNPIVAIVIFYCESRFRDDIGACWKQRVCRGKQYHNVDPVQTLGLRPWYHYVTDGGR